MPTTIQVATDLAEALAVTDLTKEWAIVNVNSRGVGITLPNRDFTRPALFWPRAKSSSPSPLTLRYKVKWGRIKDLTGCSSSNKLIDKYMADSVPYSVMLRNSVLARLEPSLASASFSNDSPLLTIKGVKGQFATVDCENLIGQATDFNGETYHFGKDEYSTLIEAVCGLCEGALLNLVFGGAGDDEDE